MLQIVGDPRYVLGSAAPFIVEIDDEKIASLVRKEKYAAEKDRDRYVEKMLQKLEEHFPNQSVVSAAVTGNLWMESRLELVFQSGQAAVLLTKAKFNSRCGNVFYQFPTYAQNSIKSAA